MQKQGCGTPLAFREKRKFAKQVGCRRHWIFFFFKKNTFKTWLKYFWTQWVKFLDSEGEDPSKKAREGGPLLAHFRKGRSPRYGLGADVFFFKKKEPCLEFWKTHTSKTLSRIAREWNFWDRRLETPWKKNQGRGVPLVHFGKRSKSSKRFGRRRSEPRMEFRKKKKLSRIA